MAARKPGARKVVTGRKNRYKKSEFRLQASFVDLNPDPVMKLDYSGKILYANPASKDLFTKSLIGKSIFTLFPDLRLPLLKKITANKPLRIESTLNDNIYSIVVKKDILTRSYYFFGSDITTIKEAQQSLQESEDKYRSLVEDSPLLICKLDTEGHFTYLNRQWEKTLGYTISEMVGHSFTEFKRPAGS